MKKKIYLIGLNLYSIFLSLKIRSKFKNADITIIEGSGKFLNAYKKIKIKNYDLNPGFHALEDIRSNKLLNILKKEIKFKKIYQTRGLIIGKSLISYLDDYNEWPIEIINKFKIKKEKISIDFSKKNNLINNNYIRYLTDNCFGREVKIKSGMSAAYPWFFPTNYDMISKDEAAIFNKKIRQKKIKHAYVFPKKGHFNAISNSLKSILIKKKIKIELKKPIKFYKIKSRIIFEGAKEINNSNYKKIICIPVKPLDDSIVKKSISTKLTPVKYYTGLIQINNFIKNDLDKFCETIVSSEFAFGLIRVSKYSEIFNIKKKNIYQFEFVEHPLEKNLEIQVEKIIKLLSNFIVFKNKKKNKNIKLIGFTWVRYIFRPKLSYVKKITSNTINFFKKNHNIIFPRQITWPINSNKHLLYAEKDFKEKIIKFLND